MALSKSAINKLTFNNKKGSWLESVNKELVERAINELQEVYKTRNLNIDVIPLSHLIIAVRDLLNLSLNSPYNQMKPFQQKIEKLGFNLVSFGKTKAIKLD